MTDVGSVMKMQLLVQEAIKNANGKVVAGVRGKLVPNLAELKAQNKILQSVKTRNKCKQNTFKKAASAKTTFALKSFKKWTVATKKSSRNVKN